MKSELSIVRRRLCGATNEVSKPCRGRNCSIFGITPMTSDQLQENWKRLIGTVKFQWDKLRDYDLTRIVGRRDQLAGLLQDRYDYDKVRAEREVDAFTQGLR